MNPMLENQLVIYQTKEGEIKIDVQLREEMVWLTQQQIATLFNRDRTVITKHISKILKDGELDDTVCANFAHTASDRKM